MRTVRNGLISILISLSLALVAPVWGQDSLRVELHPNPLLPVLQSLLVPGWGQASHGDWLLGAAHFAGGAALAGSAFGYWQSQYSRPDWDQAGKIFDKDVAFGLAGWYGLEALFSGLDSYYTTTEKRVTNPTVAALLSIAYPGWGQIANGKHGKAMAIFALQTGLAYSAYYQHQTYLFYLGQEQPVDAQFYKDDRNRLIWWSVGALIYSAADAFVDCHLRTFDVSDDLSIAPVCFPENRGVGLRIRLQL